MEEEQYELGYRKQFRSYDAGLEIVSGKVYSANHPVFAPSRSPNPPPEPKIKQHKEKKERGKRWGGVGLNDPEMKRRRRVAGYKAYGVEAKLKASLRNGLRWVKFHCSKFVNI